MTAQLWPLVLETDMADTNQSAATVASQNLKTAWANPAAKIGVAVFVLVAVIAAGAAIALLRGGGSRPGAAQGDGYSVSGGQPRGAVDPATVKAVETRSDQESRDAMDVGQSFGGPFVFEGAPSQSRGGSSTGFDETGGAGSRSGAPGSAPQPSVAIAGLKAKAAEYDSAEESRSLASGSRSSVSGGGSRSTGQGGQQGVAQGYGVTPEAFGQIAGQLSSVGTGQVRYDSLPNGILSKPPQVAVADQVAIKGSSSVEIVESKRASAFEQVAARAGQICGAAPDTAINTDYNVPVFFELLDCGLLTGAKVRGVVAKTPDDFTIRFTNISLDPKKGYRLLAQVEALSVSVKKDGSAGVADDVDNHWGTRLASSALLALARTERSFLSARGSSTVNTGTSTSVTIDPLTSEEKRTARVAGLMEGTMDVVSKDIAYGANRPATMTLDKSTLIGIQFMSDVKVVPNE